MSGELYYPEIVGSGVALFDFNNDGKLGILALQGTPLGAGNQGTVPNEPCAARLYRNDLVVNADGTRNLIFTDVTEMSGLCSRGYGMGVAVGDFNNDGCVDVFITYFGAPNQLLVFLRQYLHLDLAISFWASAVTVLALPVLRQPTDTSVPVNELRLATITTQLTG